MPDRSGRPHADEIEVELPSDATAAGAARRTTRGALTRWHLPGLCAPVALAVSELVSNAVRHGRPPVAMALRRRGGSVRVEVHDSAPPASCPPAAPGEDAESGRGLLIVEAIASATGVQQVDGEGKVAWAEFTAEQPPAPPDGTGARGAESGSSG